jgi:hypothetical protein
MNALRYSSFPLMLVVGMEVNAHSIPTHLHLTEAAVDYLAQASPHFKCTSAQKQELTAILKIGTEHEDDYYNMNEPNPLKQAAELGRFNFHFFPAMTDGLIKSSCSSLQWSGLDSGSPTSVTCHYTYAPDAVNALAKATGVYVPNVLEIKNEHTYGAAVAAAKKPHPRHAAFGEGFEHLGYVLHLLQDLTSPAHSRNDAHGYISKIPYPLQPPVLGSPDPMEVTALGRDAEHRPHMPVALLIDMPPRNLFMRLHDYVSKYFFSADTVFDKPGPAELSHHDGRVKAGCAWPTQDCKDHLGRRVAFHDPRPAGLGGAGAGKSITDGPPGSCFTQGNCGTITVSYDNAERQWAELGPNAVLFGASFINHYIETAKPLMPQGCWR